MQCLIVSAIFCNQGSCWNIDVEDIDFFVKRLDYLFRNRDCCYVSINSYRYLLFRNPLLTLDGDRISIVVAIERQTHGHSEILE